MSEHRTGEKRRQNGDIRMLFQKRVRRDPTTTAATPTTRVTTTMAETIDPTDTTSVSHAPIAKHTTTKAPQRQAAVTSRTTRTTTTKSTQATSGTSKLVHIFGAPSFLRELCALIWATMEAGDIDQFLYFLEVLQHATGIAATVWEIPDHTASDCLESAAEYIFPIFEQSPQNRAIGDLLDMITTDDMTSPELESVLTNLVVVADAIAKLIHGATNLRAFLQALEDVVLDVLPLEDAKGTSTTTSTPGTSSMVPSSGLTTTSTHVYKGKGKGKWKAKTHQ